MEALPAQGDCGCRPARGGASGDSHSSWHRGKWADVTGRNGPVTLDDVARVSGVSQAAASRALNGRKGVRPDVRERVERVAQSLGYRPNRAARNLASGRSAVIGLVIPSVDLRLDPY